MIDSPTNYIPFTFHFSSSLSTISTKLNYTEKVGVVMLKFRTLVTVNLIGFFNLYDRNSDFTGTAGVLSCTE